jgi:hypothetical protein
MGMHSLCVMPLLAQDRALDMMIHETALQPLTPDTWRAVDALGVISGESMHQAAWLNNSQIIALVQAGLWIYTINTPGQTHVAAFVIQWIGYFGTDEFLDLIVIIRAWWDKNPTRPYTPFITSTFGM